MAVQQAHPASRVDRQVDPAGKEMRAVRIHRFGPPDVLVVDTVPRPAAGPGDLLVQVAAAGVNPADWKIRSGGGARVALPFVLGGDVAGSVVGVGDDVSGWAAGEPVYASTQLHGRQLGEIAALVDGGELVPQVSTVLPLAEAARAHEISATGHTRGKIVLTVMW